MRGVVHAEVDRTFSRPIVGAHEDLPRPRGSAVLGGVILRVALFAFAGHVLLGSCWQLYVGVALFALPDVLAVIDNLVKGAAGQAVQCFNLMFGLDETAGLDATALWP